VVIEVDGPEAGRLRSSENLVTRVEPGRRNLRARQRTIHGVLLELVLAPGEDVRLKTRR
jgi:hypothetical protein